MAQCKAIVYKKGHSGEVAYASRCGRLAREKSDLCWQHEGQTVERWFVPTEAPPQSLSAELSALGRFSTGTSLEFWGNPMLQMALDKLTVIEELLTRQVELLHKLVRAGDTSGAMRIAHEVFAAKDRKEEHDE